MSAQRAGRVYECARVRRVATGASKKGAKYQASCYRTNSVRCAAVDSAAAAAAAALSSLVGPSCAQREIQRARETSDPFFACCRALCRRPTHAARADVAGHVLGELSPVIPPEACIASLKAPLCGLCGKSPPLVGVLCALRRAAGCSPPFLCLSTTTTAYLARRLLLLVAETHSSVVNLPGLRFLRRMRTCVFADSGALLPGAPICGHMACSSCSLS